MRTEDKVTRSERGVKSLMKALSGDPDFLAASRVLVRGEAAAKPTVALASAEPSKSFVHSNWLVTENPSIRDLLENNQLADRVVVTTDPFVRSSAYDVGVFVHDAFTADSTVLFEMSRLILNSKAKKAFVLTHKRTGAQRLARRTADELGFQVSLEARGSGGIRVLKVGASEETGRLDPPYQHVDVSGPDQPALDLLTTPSLFSPDRVDPGSMMLIEYALNLIGDERREQCLLDLGCGYGAVGLSLTSWLPNTNVLMTDADARAVYVCRKNVSRLRLRNSARVMLTDGVQGIKGEFELIVWNPPLHSSFPGLVSILRDALQLLKRKGAMVLVVETSKVDSLNAMVNTAGVASEVVRGEGHSIIRATAGS